MLWRGLLYLFAHMYDAAVTTMLYRSVILYYLSPAVVSVRICCSLPAFCISMRSFALCIPLRWVCYKLDGLDASRLYGARACRRLSRSGAADAALTVWMGKIPFPGLTTCELLLEILLRKQPSTDPRTA